MLASHPLSSQELSGPLSWAGPRPPGAHERYECTESQLCTREGDEHLLRTHGVLGTFVHVANSNPYFGFAQDTIMPIL